MSNLKQYTIYLVKLGDEEFKFGITTDFDHRLSNLITTGYSVVAIGESGLCSKLRAVNLENRLKRLCGTNDRCSSKQVAEVIRVIKLAYGFSSYNAPSIDVYVPKQLRLGQKIKIDITEDVISDATKKCTSSTSECVVAIGLLKQGKARPDVQGHRTKFSMGGFRYTCQNNDDAAQALYQFDEDKTKLKPTTVSVVVTKIKPISTRPYVQRAEKSSAETISPPIKKAARRTKGRDKGLVKYFDNTTLKIDEKPQRLKGN